MEQGLPEDIEEVPSKNAAPRAYFAFALAAECVYLTGRTVILPFFESEVSKELAITSWRVPFVLLYAWILFSIVGNSERTRGPPSHPLLWAAIVLSLLAGPPAWGYVPLDSTVIVFIFTAPIIAMREELFFRGILQSALEKVLHPVVAILVTVAVFVASHIGMQDLNAYTISALTGLGLLCGVIYQRTRNLWVVVLVHTFFDCIGQLPPLETLTPPLVLLGNAIAIVGGIVWWFLDQQRQVRPPALS